MVMKGGVEREGESELDSLRSLPSWVAWAVKGMKVGDPPSLVRSKSHCLKITVETQL
jgi:hypothetical protein